jgi:hypothetical protein
LAVLYLPEADIQGTSMGVHVRIPQPDGDALFRVTYWPTNNPNDNINTEAVPLNHTQGGTGDVVLSDLVAGTEYSYRVFVQSGSGSGFVESDGLEGDFRGLPAPTDDEFTFVSTSCIMLQMSLGRRASTFTKVSRLFGACGCMCACGHACLGFSALLCGVTTIQLYQLPFIATNFHSSLSTSIHPNQQRSFSTSLMFDLASFVFVGTA